MVFQDWKAPPLEEKKEVFPPRKPESPTTVSEQNEKIEQVKSVLEKFIPRYRINRGIIIKNSNGEASYTSLSLAKLLLGDEVKPSDTEEVIYNKLLKKFDGDVKELKKFLKAAENDTSLLSPEGLKKYLENGEDDNSTQDLSSFYGYLGDGINYGINWVEDYFLGRALMIIAEAAKRIAESVWKTIEEFEKKIKEFKKQLKEIYEKKVQDKKILQEKAKEKVEMLIAMKEAVLEKLKIIPVSLESLDSVEEVTGVISQIVDAIKSLAALSASIETEGIAQETDFGEVISTTISNLEKAKKDLQSKLPEDQLIEKELA